MVLYLNDINSKQLFQVLNVLFLEKNSVVRYRHNVQIGFRPK